MFWLKPDAVFVDGTLRSDLAVLVSRGDGDGQIVSLGVPNPRDGASVIELPRRVLLPGFVNAHSQSWQRALRGWVQHSAPPTDGASWRDALAGLARRMTPEALEAIATLTFAEMLHAGFTTVGESLTIHRQPDGTPYAEVDELALRVVAAARRVGIRLVVLVGGETGEGVLAARGRMDDPEAWVETVGRLRGRGLEVGLSLPDPTVLPDEWLKTLALCPAVLHAPVATRAERGAADAEVVSRLADTGVLGPRFTALHLTHPTDDDLARLVGAEVMAAACPSTELDLGAGFFQGGRVDMPLAIGTGANVLIDPFAELRALEWNTRAALGRRDAHAHESGDGLAAELLANGSEHGARSLGVHAGRIAVGQVADLVSIDSSRMEFGMSRLLPAIVFNGTPAAVRDVWVGGRHVVRDGRVPGGEAVVAEAERALRRIAR